MSLLLDYTGEKFCSRSDLHRHWAGFKPVASAFGLRERKKSPRQDLHLHFLRSKRSASALGYAGKMVLPAGISPATSAFEARRSIHCATGALESGAPGRFRPVCLLSVSEVIYY